MRTRPRSSPTSLLPLLFFAAATVAMTWPLARDIRTAVPDHDDAFFGIWRMAWVAHQLPRAPAHLFDANIFVPTPNTLALSDAALLQGLLAAPPLAAAIQILARQFLRPKTTATVTLAPPPTLQIELLRERLTVVQAQINERSEPPSPEIVSLIDRLDKLIEKANQEELFSE